MACTHLYIRHTPGTCRICSIGPYTTSDTSPVHIYTSDIHPVHVVYAVFGHIQPVIHGLYTVQGVCLMYKTVSAMYHWLYISQYHVYDMYIVYV